MNPAIAHVLQFFKYDHLPEKLQAVSQPFAFLADRLAAGPANQETTIALRKLLEAKDAAVRAAICGGGLIAIKHVDVPGDRDMFVEGKLDPRDVNKRAEADRRAAEAAAEVTRGGK